jgi:hypothetical protein
VQLWSHIAQRPSDSVARDGGHLCCGVEQNCGQAKVNQPGVAALVDQDVDLALTQSTDRTTTRDTTNRLQVSVDDAEGVHEFQTAKNLLDL